MVERPILFSAPMVRAILAGRKTQTRRIYKPRVPAPYEIMDETGTGVSWPFAMDEAGQYHTIRCPYGVVGNGLRVRETYAFERQHDEWKPSEIPDGDRVWFLADGPKPPWAGKTRPAIFLPTWASRIHLRVTGVRVERLQSITEDDAKAEGAAFHDGRGVGHSGWRHNESDVYGTARDLYAALWAKINGLESLKANPYVWVVSFDRPEAGA